MKNPEMPSNNTIGNESFIGTEETILEEREERKIGNEVTIDFVRHGQAVYFNEGRPKNKNEKIQFEGTLTESGLKQIEVTAKEISEKIDDKSKEMVILWISPRKRASESMEKLKEILIENGVNVFPKQSLAKSKKNLIDMGLTGEFLEEGGEEKKLKWMDFWKKESENFENIESEEDFMKRMQELISYFQQFSQKAKLSSDVKIRFICLTHEEQIKNIAEYFGISIENVKNGEIMEMNISPKEDAPAELDIRIQGQEGHLKSDQLFTNSV